MAITFEIVSFISTCGEVYSMQLNASKFFYDFRQVVDFQ
jgi:hypothetical protein